MKYTLNTTNYYDFDVYEINKLPGRSWFIPFSSRETADLTDNAHKRYQSDKVTCLSGIWDFRFFENPNYLNEEIESEDFFTDTIPIPSCWQTKGYGKPIYLNTRYLFPYDPPYIPDLDPVKPIFSWNGADRGFGIHWSYPENEYNYVGVYRKTFDLEIKDNTSYIISFLGAASCLDLYVNGQFIGYSQGSHNTAEFDITDVLDSHNEILCVVHRWCNGTYLEAQDMFRYNGIFRDVLLYEHKDTDIFDYQLNITKTGDGYDCIITAEGYRSNIEFTASLLSETKHSNNGIVAFSDLTVNQWSAECPNLYDLYLETEGSCIKVQIGFKDVRIEGNKFYFNDRLIKLHGVNHHDTHPKNGYTMSMKDIEKDIQLCKEFNIDTLRTSHYPPDPYLLECCDELGIYVVDEADIETHGVWSHVLPPDYSRISRDKAWAAQYVDRAIRMVYRDRNHPSIIMFSLGNESGAGICTNLEYEAIKKISSLPVHYESAIHTDIKAYDVASEMYPDAKHVKQVGELSSKVDDKLKDRPYFLCEYAHAMGTGPGNIESYWDVIYAYDNLMGGCIWEMVDHAFEEDGCYTYGGDHDEYMHDGNFCVDGLFYPDRKPSTGAYIARHAYRPIIFSHIRQDEFEIWNTTGFTNADKYIFECSWNNGESFTLLESVEPLQRKRIRIPLPDTESINGDVLLTIKTLDKQRNEKSVEQLCVLQKEYVIPDVGRQSYDYFIRGNKPILKIGNQSLEGFTTILYRAHTDNDVNLLGVDVIKPFYDLKEEILSIQKFSDKICIRSRLSSRAYTFICTDTISSSEKGIHVHSLLHCRKGMGNVPRFGKIFRLPKEFDFITYYGRNGESYADMKYQYPVDTVQCGIWDMVEPSIRPQESGNRMDCHFVRLESKHELVTIASGQAFELTVKPYSEQELMQMRHREDIVFTGVYVGINAFQMGIGTGSCGPGCDEKYLYPVKQDYELDFYISTAKKVE